MADPAGQPARQQPKIMSSRLQGMKFMQRASSLTSLKSKSTSSPKSAAHPSPRTEDQEPHAAKRVKTSHSANYLPITPNNASTPVSATYSARRPTGLRAEDGERDAAFEGSGGAERGGETKWFFSFRAEDDTGVCGNVTNGGLKVEIMGTRPSMEEDSDVEGDETPPWSGDEGLGRRLFGVDKKGWARSRARSDGRHLGQSSHTRTDQNPSDSNSDSDTSNNDSEEDEEEYDPEQAAMKPECSADAEAMIEAQRKTQRRADRKAAAAELLAQVEQPPRRAVELSKLSTISGTAGPGAKKATDVVCFFCKEKGHMKKDCPQKGLPY